MAFGCGTSTGHDGTLFVGGHEKSVLAVAHNEPTAFNRRMSDQSGPSNSFIFSHHFTGTYGSGFKSGSCRAGLCI